MGKSEIQKIVIVGSGNVATQLALAFQKAGYIITQIYGRKLKMAQCLASKINVPYTTDLNLLEENADLYVVSIIDDALADIISKINIKDRLIVHTSGTTDISVFGNDFSHFGVFYPLQTFSKEKAVDFDAIPICIEAASTEDEKLLLDLADSISDKVQHVNSEQRRLLHIAAVFACNFSNYFYAISAELLNDYDLDFDLLKPLITETANKIKHIHPDKAQTGPAKRGDHKIIKQHLEMLSDYPDFLEIYDLLTKKIIKRHLKND